MAPETQTSSPQNVPSSSRRSLAIIDDPDIQQVISEDPLFRFLTTWWRQLLVLALAIALGVYAKQRFEQSREFRLSEAADILSRVHSQYEGLLAARSEIKRLEGEKAKKGAADQKEAQNQELQKIDEQLTKAQTDFNESRRLMSEYVTALSDSVAPYDSLAKLYSGLLSFVGSEPQKAAEELGGLSALWKEQDAKDHTRLVSELAALSTARMLVDQEASYAQGRSQLRQLAQSAHYVRASAAVALARISETAQEKDEARPLLEGVISQYPELAEQLQPELSALKN